MSWVKLDDGFTKHPKILQAGPLAAWLYICGLTYCSIYLTDGLIPVRAVKILADLPDVESLAKRLVQAGLWVEERNGVSNDCITPLVTGYIVHDYLDYQPSRATILVAREATKQRQARFRAATTQNSNAVSNAHPVPVPVPSREGTNVPSLSSKLSERNGVSNANVTPSRKRRDDKTPRLTDDETLGLHAEYDAALTSERVTTEIASALDHEAAYKRGKSGSWKLYVQSWLRRAAASPPALFRSSPASLNGSAPPDKYKAERERIAKLGVAEPLPPTPTNATGKGRISEHPP